LTYIDTSSLLRLFAPVEQFRAIEPLISTSDVIVLSSITFMESHIQLKSRLLGGIYKQKLYEEATSRLDGYRSFDPFVYKKVPGEVFERGVLQAKAPQSLYLRSMDRLHLSAMELLGCIHLITNDIQQSDVARAMGYQVTIP